MFEGEISSLDLNSWLNYLMAAAQKNDWNYISWKYFLFDLIVDL